MKAWLITREQGAPHLGVKREDRIAAILNSRLSGDRVREIVELMCANEQLGLEERLAYAKHKKDTPFRAEFGSASGVRWSGEVFCGYHPILWARKVDIVRVMRNEDGEEDLIWTEIPRPDLSHLK